MILTRIKKNIFKFNPELHWKIILSIALLLSVLAGVYSAYLYAYAQKQIVESNQNSIHATSSKIIKDVSTDSITTIFDIYKEKENVYRMLLDKAYANVKKGISAVATTSLATTTKQ